MAAVCRPCGAGQARNQPTVARDNAPAHLLVEGVTMLGTLAVVLVILWLLGMITSYTLGGFIHILLVIAVVVILIRLISGRRVV